MLIFDPERESRDPNFNTVLERLRALVADMEAVRAGCAPAGLASEPPLLDRWTLGWRPAACLTGHSTGHPLLPGTERQILTSDLQLLSHDRQWARTTSRWYQLGAPGGVSHMPPRKQH